MPAVLTQKSIMLLARERLAWIRDSLQAKVDTGATVTDLEHRVLYLAKKAHAMMSVSPPPTLPADDPDAATLYGRGVSKFAVMGSLGSGLTAYSALLAAGQEWVFNTQHRGTPDRNHEAVVARTTDFVFEFWRQVSSAISSSDMDADTKRESLEAMRAYVLGYVCHVAGNTLSNPWISGLEWQLAPGSSLRPRITGGEIDSRVAIQVLQRPNPREGEAWSRWWPSLDEVPPQFYEAYAAAFSAVYQPNGQRVRGLAEFEEGFALREPPPVNADLIRDGYNFYSHGVLGMAYGFGYWDWWAVFLPVAIPLVAMFPIAAALPRAKKLFRDPPWDADEGERGLYELMTLPLALMSISTLIYGIWLMAITNKGMAGTLIPGLIHGIVSFILGVVFFATLGVDDLDPWLRWLLIFGVPAAGSLYFLIRALIDMEGSSSFPFLRFADWRGAKGAVEMLFALPIVVLFMVMLVYFTFFLPVSQLLIAADASDTVQTVGFWVMALAVTVLFVVGWFLISRAIREALMPEMPDNERISKRQYTRSSFLPTDRPHFVRLFDDATLHHDPAVAAPTLAQRSYPSSARKLLKFWWEGAGDLYIRAGRVQLEFSTTGLDEDPIQVVAAPVAPMKASEFAAFLARTVKDSGGVTGGFKAEMAYPADLDYELPPGAVFSDHGDREENTAGHDEKAREFKKLGTVNDDDVYLLYHAPKSHQAIFFGRRGPAASDGREDEVIPGTGTVSSDGTTVTGDGTIFRTFFVPGDFLRANGQQRLVTLVSSENALVVASPFNPDLPEDSDFSRVGPDLERRDGYEFVADPVGTMGRGDTIMDYAADLAALLSMGVAPHLLTNAELTVPTLSGKTASGGGPLSPTLNKVYQVFRNWNMDERRVNEWRMLVTGGALSEKGGSSSAYDAAMTQPREGGYSPVANDIGERVSRELGWVNLLRRWMDMAKRPDANAADTTVPAPGQPANKDLSQAIAFMLDMPEPVTLA